MLPKPAGLLSARLGPPAVLGELPIPVALGPTFIDLLHRPAFADAGELVLKLGDPAVGKEIKDVKLRPDTVLVSIRRVNRLIIPRGDTVLSADDKILAATRREKQKSCGEH